MGADSAGMHTDRPILEIEICDRLSRGETLTSICRDPHMPERTTAYDWINDSEEFSQRVSRARFIGHDAIADDCVDIADDTARDYVTGPQGPAFNAEHVQRSKLRIETRLKLLSKWDAKRYGDKQQVEHSGAIDTSGAILAARKRSGN